MTTNELKRALIGMQKTNLTELQRLALIGVATSPGGNLETVALSIIETETTTRPLLKVLAERGLIHKKDSKRHYLTELGTDLIEAWIKGKSLTEFEKLPPTRGNHDFSNAREKQFPSIPPLPPRP